jgi:hypothetical protein
MVLGYWDGNGFGNLVPGSAATQTAAVDDMIATEGPSSNYTDYCEPMDNPAVDPEPLPDLSEPPEGDEHADECLADFLETSQSFHDNYYGWGWFSAVGPGVEAYVRWLDQGYTATSANHYWYTTLNWTLLQTEIDAGRPLLFSVDSNADGSADHFVTVVGYDSPGGVQKYACHNTWSTSVSWYDFQQMSSGVSYGVSKAITFQLEESNHRPTLGTVEPDSGSGQTGTMHHFKTTWFDEDGWYDLKQCYFHIGASPSLYGNVTLLYNRHRNKLWLLDDDGTWTGGFAPGTSELVENDQAILHCYWTDLGYYSDKFYVRWAIEFKPTFLGLKKLGLKAKDMSGAKAKGAWKGTFLIEP